MKSIGVLNLQGAVSEHFLQLKQIENVTPVLVKTPSELAHLDGLIIPGGESTAISRLIKQNNLFDAIKSFAKQGKGIFGTCAGLVLCGKTTTHIDESDKSVIPLNLINIVVERNGFGRQIDSFEINLDIDEVGKKVHAIFIRAPYIASYSSHVKPLAFVDNKCVMAMQKNILVSSFHPELSQDLRIMQYFVDHFC